MRKRQAFDDRGLADARLADQHRIVLGAAGQNLDGAADFLVTTNDRIELAVARGLGQITGIFLERLIGVLGRRGIRGAALAQGFDRGVEGLRRHAGLGQDLSGVAVFLERQRQQKPLDGDEGIAGLVGDLLRLVENPRHRGREVELARAAAGDFRHFGKRGLGRRQRIARAAAGAVDQAAGQPFRIVQQHFQKVFGCELLMPLTQGKRLRGLHEAARTFGEFLKIHLYLPPLRRAI